MTLIYFALAGIALCLVLIGVWMVRQDKRNVDLRRAIMELRMDKNDDMDSLTDYLDITWQPVRGTGKFIAKPTKKKK